MQHGSSSPGRCRRLLAGALVVVAGATGATNGSGGRTAAAAPDFAAAIGELGDRVVGLGTTTFDAVSVSTSFRGDEAQQLFIGLSGDEGDLFLELTAPPARTFDVFSYAAGAAVPEADRAGISLTQDIGCDAEGSFEILEYEREPDWTVTSLVLRWNARCAGSVGSNSGIVRYRSDRPVTAFRADSPFAAFGPHVVGTRSREQVLRFENVGPSASVPTITQQSGATLEFGVVDDRCTGVRVEPGASCSVSVRYEPSVDGLASELFALADSTFPFTWGAKFEAIGEGVPVGGGADGEFTGLTPSRILDTRAGVGAPKGPVGPSSWTAVQVAGRGGVPRDGVSAVVLNVTAVRPTASTYVSLSSWESPPAPDPDDAVPMVEPPEVSNLNAEPGEIVANMVTVGINDFDGTVAVYNDLGETHLLFDVVGYYSEELGPEGSRYVPFVPDRLFDTRFGLGVPTRPVGAGRSIRYDVGDRLPDVSSVLPGIVGPPTAVVLNVTVARPTAWSFLTVHPGDVPTPTASHLNYVAGQRVANLVTVRLPADGVVEFHNEFGSAELIVDLVGMYQEGEFVGGRFEPIGPHRVVDTRVDIDQQPLRPGESLEVPISQTFGIPADATAAVTNVTAARATDIGFFTVMPADECDVPGSSNLNFAPGQRVANQVIAALSGDGGCGPGEGWMSVFNPIGETHAIVDVFGYFR